MRYSMCFGKGFITFEAFSERFQLSSHLPSGPPAGLCRQRADHSARRKSRGPLRPPERSGAFKEMFIGVENVLDTF